MDKYFELTSTESDATSKGKRRRRPKKEKEEVPNTELWFTTFKSIICLKFGQGSV